MSKPTEAKNSFRKSFGAGLQAVVKPAARTYYVLQHRTVSKQSYPGQNQEVIVDYALLGRSREAVVRFGDDMDMVSNQHASITKENGKWVIQHLSKVNETIVNGRPVREKWFLQHGDEIQLANGGPRLGFLVPDNPTVGSIGLSRRLSLFRQQALRPYRYTLIGISALFLLSTAALIWWSMRMEKNLLVTQVNLAESQEVQVAQTDSIVALSKQNKEIQEKFKREINNLDQTISGLRRRAEQAARAAAAAQQAIEAGEGGSKVNLPGEMEPYSKDVYFLEVSELSANVEDSAGNVTRKTAPNLKWYGTGFVLSDGRFITSRHVIQPWYYFKSNEEDGSLVLLNIWDNSGANLEVKITAYGPNGKVLHLSSKDFKVDKSGDQKTTRTIDGEDYEVKIARNNALDYAVANSGSGDLVPMTSNHLTEGNVLYSLSYPGAFGATDLEDVRPHFIKIVVSRRGREGGYITGSGAGIAPGSSGGPVFYKDDDGIYKVVGIISAITGNNLDFIVPIDRVR